MLVKTTSKFSISILFFLLSVQFLIGQDSIMLKSNPVDKKKLARAIVTETVLYSGLISGLGFVWYKDAERVPFHLYKDGKGYLQMDKMGHAYGAYVESYLCYKWLRSAGVSKNKSLLFGGTMGIVMQTPIEVFDGLYENWGFSWSDMVANTAGSVLLMGQEIIFDRQYLQYKFSFQRSEYADQANGYLGDNTLESLFYDYNGHTYWLSTNLNNFIHHDRVPDWLNIAVGYSANGMFGEFENRTSWRGVSIPETERTRQFLLSPDIDWTKIPTNSKLLKDVFTALNFIKFPAPAFEINSKGKMKGYWIYL